MRHSYGHMKVQFKQPVAVDLETQDEELSSKSFNRWDVVRVNEIIDCGTSVNLILENGDAALYVPKSTFKVLD